MTEGTVRGWRRGRSGVVRPSQGVGSESPFKGRGNTDMNFVCAR